MFTYGEFSPTNPQKNEIWVEYDDLNVNHQEEDNQSQVMGLRTMFTLGDDEIDGDFKSEEDTPLYEKGTDEIVLDLEALSPLLINGKDEIVEITNEKGENEPISIKGADVIVTTEIVGDDMTKGNDVIEEGAKSMDELKTQEMIKGSDEIVVQDNKGINDQLLVKGNDEIIDIDDTVNIPEMVKGS